MDLAYGTDDDRRGCSRCCGPQRWKKWAWGIGIICLGIFVVVILAFSLQKLDSTEYGVEYTPYSKKLSDAAKTGGLHSGPPGFEFIKFPSTFITEDLPDGTCVSQDGLRVDYKVTFQYQMTEENLLPVIIKYRDFEKWAQVVNSAGTSAVQHTCSEFQISNFQNQRGLIQQRMQENLKRKLEGSGTQEDPGVYALVISLQLKNVNLPEEYKDAVADKQSAAEDIELAKNQRKQEVTKANTALLAAEEEARKINDTAVNEAGVIITEATLKAEETTFAFETEAEIVATAKQNFNFTTEGVLAYMANRLYSEASSLKVSAGEPARMSWKEEL